MSAIFTTALQSYKKYIKNPKVFGFWVVIEPSEMLALILTNCYSSSSGNLNSVIPAATSRLNHCIAFLMSEI